MSACKLCGLDHRGWISCAKAHVDASIEQIDAKIAKFSNPDTLDPELLALATEVVANKLPVANRYKDKEKRKAYMRELMRKRRAR